MSSTAYSKTRPIQRRSLHQELLEQLRGLITDGTLRPGMKVPERELCERFGVSRTPLREALKVLASDGTVTLRPNRGATIAEVTLEELEEVFPVIGALEALAGEIACQKITPAELAEIRELHEEMVAHWKAGSVQEYFRCNRHIHEAILSATRNPCLQTHYSMLAARISNFRYVAGIDAERWRLAIEEHEAILAALEVRDSAALQRIMRVHLANKLETVRNWLEKQ